MLTPDQIRLRLERMRLRSVETGAAALDGLALLGLLSEVLPDLVEQAEARRLADLVQSKWCHGCKVGFQDEQAHFGSSFHRQNLERLADIAAHRECPDCTDEAPCQRVRALLEGAD